MELVFLADLPLLLVLIGRRWPRWQELRVARAIRISAVVVALALFACWDSGVLDSSESAADGDVKVAEQHCVREYGLLAFTLHDYFAGNRAYRHSLLHVSHRAVRFPPGRPLRNIYLIQVEAMDARIVGFKYRGPGGHAVPLRVAQRKHLLPVYAELSQRGARPTATSRF